MLRCRHFGPPTASLLVAASLSLTMPVADVALAACPPGYTLYVPSSISLNGKPNRVVLQDFNSDGKLDIAASLLETSSGNPGNQVVVMLGTGSGAFDPPTYLTVGPGPAALCAAYLDADNALDLAVSSRDSNSLSLFHGVGDGTFVPLGVVPCGPRPYELASSDFNEDGTADLVVALNQGGGPPTFAIQVLIGTGGGSFATPVSYALPSVGLGVAVGRINGDVHVDVVATAAAQGGVVFFGNGDGTLGSGIPLATGPETYDVTLADLDADGDLDVAAANTNHGGVRILRGDGLGGFDAPLTFAASYNVGGIAVGDFDHDAIPDFATTVLNFDRVWLFRGIGADGVPTGTFEPFRAIDVGAFPVGLSAGLSDVDMRTDLVVAAFEGRSLTKVMSNCPEEWAGVSGDPAALLLAPPAPNPVRLGAQFQFALPRESGVRLTLHDLQGRLVRELSRGTLPAGPHSVAWDGRDRSGQLVRSGLYLLKLEAGGQIMRTRVVVTR